MGSSERNSVTAFVAKDQWKMTLTLVRSCPNIFGKSPSLLRLRTRDWTSHIHIWNIFQYSVFWRTSKTQWDWSEVNTVMKVVNDTLTMFGWWALFRNGTTWKFVWHTTKLLMLNNVEIRLNGKSAWTLPSIHSTPSTSNGTKSPLLSFIINFAGAITPGTAQLAATADDSVTLGVLIWFSNSRCTPDPA